MANENDDAHNFHQVYKVLQWIIHYGFFNSIKDLFKFENPKQSQET